MAVAEEWPSSAEGVLALNALEGALRRLEDDVRRAGRRYHEVRRAYERMVEVTHALREPAGIRSGSAAGRLTARERLVAALAADGRSNSQVAHELQVSPQTVKTQMRSILRKLDLDSRWQIAARLAYPDRLSVIGSAWRELSANDPSGRQPASQPAPSGPWPAQRGDARGRRGP
jgi:DNA-binding CsgD family transcriptional regulator